MSNVLEHKSIMFVDDPNSINVNPELVNAIPQYQDMHIYAELTAVRKGRSVITIGDEFETDDTFKVNFIGVNQNTDSPNNMAFSTNYYDGSTPSNEKQLESFGISNIKVTVNSSYVPQVDIQFIDYRGLSFFNQENSPYRILFDFPPPIFNLKIKGYYGRTLEYNLHLVKYDSAFVSDNGNFVIDAQFVALTFAPLSDILFRYITNMPLIVNKDSMIPKTNEKPKNTYELILKIQNLYSEANKLIDKSEEKILYDEALKEYGKIQSAISILENYKNILKEKGEPILFTKDTKIAYTPSIPVLDENGNNIIYGSHVETNANIIKLKNIRDYNSTIKSLKDYISPDSIKNRLFVGYLMAANKSKQNELLLDFKNRLLSAGADFVTDNSIKVPEIVNDATTISTLSIPDSYFVIDITTYYVELYKKRLEVIERRKNLSKNINVMVNNSILQNLGMIPTIYNVFEIILNDVDTFFDILKKTSVDAENHHNRLKNEIASKIAPNDMNVNSDYLYSFPLIIKNETGRCFNREVRVSPKEINDTISEPFPESKLVSDFIDSFNRQKQYAVDFKVRGTVDTDGNAVWIPISPLDSDLGNVSPITPYVGRVGNIDAVLQILLDRFNILTQYALPENFYDTDDNNASKSYIDLYSYSEALNIALSVNDSTVSNNLIAFAKNYMTPRRVENFYRYLDNNVNITNYNKLDNNYVIDGEYYVNKNNTGYKGSSVYVQDIELQTIPQDDKNPLSVFLTEVNEKKRKYKWWFGKTKLPQSSYSFTKENVLYIKDVPVSDGMAEQLDDENSYNNIPITTRYITQTSTMTGVGVGKVNFNNLKDIQIANINKLLNEGNSGFDTMDNTNRKVSYDSKYVFNNVIDVWINELYLHDNKLYNKVINESSHLSAILLLSNFGYTLSSFNIYPKNLNDYIFQTPAAVEVPSYLPLYIGSLVNAKTNGRLDDLIDYFTNGDGYYLTSKGLLIFADIYDIDKYLSNEDKAYYKKLYDDFYTNSSNKTDYNDIRKSLKEVYNKANATTDVVEKGKIYNNSLNPIDNDNYDTDNDYHSKILSPLLDRKNIIIYSQNTFRRYTTNIDTVYQPLKTVNLDSTKKVKNNDFFSNFFTKLVNILENKNVDIEEQETEATKLIGDEDVSTQLYYSFKNINDKWLSNPNKNFGGSSGYPSNRNGRKLIDSFAFIDRAMNPIGDTIINPEILLDLFEDTNVTVFSVLSQLLSMNGFEFFPLQNFMTHNRESWEDSFKIDSSGLISKRDAFVCMYVGGSSSYPSNISKNGFVNDGIIDITNTDAVDFNLESNDCNSKEEYDKQVENNPDFPYKQVRAFRVKFGEQNQSMFKDIKIDSKEFPETNESLQILARLAGDEGKNQPTPKGQNLYNLYENRAYQATISGLGNAMIQPTQYFQLDNVPLFNGAYLILSVQHEITANKMSTTFSGTKILKYPIPRVMNPAAVMGFDIGSSDVTDWDTLSDTTALTNAGNPNVFTGETLNNIPQLNAPISPNLVRNVSPYNRDGVPYPDGREHYGIDFSANAGTEIWAVADGIVHKKYKDGEITGYGNFIILDHGNNKYSAYGHLLDSSPNITEGQVITAGTVIGYCGSTGRSEGAHLHFEYRTGVGGGGKNGDDCCAIDPRPYLEKSMKSVWINLDKKLA